MEINEENLSIPILRNWIAYQQGNPSQGYFEYELLSDVGITGDNNTDFGPYEFMTAFNREKEVKASLIVRVDERRSNRIPSLNKTNVDYYHGGELIDEIAALVSLTMGVRIKAGRMIREFRSSDDRFGRNTDWHKIPAVHQIKPLYGQYKLPAVIHECGIDLLAPLKGLPNLSEDSAAVLIKAARFYQEALWIAETEPSLSWIMCVSALEIAANQWKRGQDIPSKRLEASNKELYDYLKSLNLPDIVDKVAEYIKDSLGATQKFVDFVINFLPAPPDKRPQLAFQCSWDKVEMQKMMRIIYGHRSNVLHGGTPFPGPMCQAPMVLPDQSAPAEKPPGLGTYTKNGTWLIKDTPMLLNTFEYVTRNCLLAWWGQLGK